jgi:hypothetical protein
MTPQESGLRRRVQNLYRIYRLSVWRLTSLLPDWETFSVVKPEVVAKFPKSESPTNNTRVNGCVISTRLTIRIKLTEFL